MQIKQGLNILEREMAQERREGRERTRGRVKEERTEVRKDKHEV